MIALKKNKRRKLLSSNDMQNAATHSVFREISERGTDECFEPSAAPEPTEVPIGCFDRLDVYARRLLRGEHLWHDEDSTTVAVIEVQREMHTKAIEDHKRLRGR